MMQLLIEDPATNVEEARGALEIARQNEENARENKRSRIEIFKLQNRRMDCERNLAEAIAQIQKINIESAAEEEIAKITSAISPNNSWGSKSRDDIVKMAAGGPKVTDRVRSQRTTPSQTTPSPVPNARRTPSEFMDDLELEERERMRSENVRELAVLRENSPRDFEMEDLTYSFGESWAD